jgi:hypothetical protein
MDGKLTGRLSAVGGLKGTLSPVGGLRGTLSLGSGTAVPYTGEYEVTPKAHQDQVLPTNGLLMLNDVTVFEVPYYETSNLFDGLTAYIASEV